MTRSLSALNEAEVHHDPLVQFRAWLDEEVQAGLRLPAPVVLDTATLVISELWYQGRGLTLHLGSGTLAPFLGAVGASMLAAGIGVGVGALFRRQTGAIVAILLWLLIGEGVISAVGDASRFAPGHALAAVVAAHSTGSRDMLAVWPAAVVGLLYVAIFCGAGFLVVIGSDVPSITE